MFIRKENDYLSKKALNMNLKFSHFSFWFMVIVDARVSDVTLETFMH